MTVIIELLKNYSMIFLIVLIAPVLVVSIYYGLGYSILMRFVDPSFELKRERLLELIISFYIFSCLSIFYIDIISSHFHIPSEIVNDFKFLFSVPCILFVVLRCIVRFHSSRIARDHLNIIIFIALVSSSVTCTYSMFNATHIDFSFFDREFFIMALFLSISIPLCSETILSLLHYIPIYEKYIIKQTRLIDLSEELPAKIEFIFGEKEINDKIYRLISDNVKLRLRIITNKYSTVEKNIDNILRRCNGEGGVSIIGSADQDEVIQRRFTLFESKGLLFCPGVYDKIRLIIDGEQRLLLSFATSGNKGSHVGIYSEHPFIISLFINYFDTKCKAMGCGICHKRQCVKDNSSVKS